MTSNGAAAPAVAACRLGGRVTRGGGNIAVRRVDGGSLGWVDRPPSAPVIGSAARIVRSARGIAAAQDTRSVARLRGAAVAADDRRLGTRHGAVGTTIHPSFERPARAWCRNARGRTGAGRIGEDDSAPLHRLGADHALAHGIGKLRVATEERCHIRRGPGTFSAGTTTDTTAEDIADRRVRIFDVGSGEATRRAADEAPAAVAAQPVADCIRRERGLIDMTVQELIRGDERPWTEVDHAGVNPSRPAAAIIEAGPLIGPVGPVVIGTKAVVPAHRRPADVAWS